MATEISAIEFRTQAVATIEATIKQILDRHKGYWDQLDKLNARSSDQSVELTSTEDRDIDLKRSTIFNEMLENKALLADYDARLVKARKELEEDTGKVKDTSGKK